MINLLKSFLPGTLLAFNVHASPYQYEYEDEPAASRIVQAKDMQAQAMLAAKKGVPLMVEFSTPWCSYCETLEKEVLEPLIVSGDYEDRVLIRKLEVSDYNSVVDFAGQKRSSIELASALNIELYPTLVFFDDQGKEVGRRLVGIRVFEFIFDEIDRALASVREQSNQKL